MIRWGDLKSCCSQHKLYSKGRRRYLLLNQERGAQRCSIREQQPKRTLIESRGDRCYCTPWSSLGSRWWSIRWAQWAGIRTYYLWTWRRPCRSYHRRKRRGLPTLHLALSFLRVLCWVKSCLTQTSSTEQPFYPSYCTGICTWQSQKQSRTMWVSSGRTYQPCVGDTWSRQ